MNWTTEQPTKPGFYWVRIPRQSEPEFCAPIVVQVQLHDDRLACVSLGVYIGDENAAKMKWAGPLTPPIDAEEIYAVPWWTHTVNEKDGTVARIENRLGQI